MRLRRMVMFCIVAGLGAATVVLPGIASSETPPTISAYSYTHLAEEIRYWLPASAHVGEGASVKFINASSEVKHGLEFTGGPAKPNCTGLPAAAGEVAGATSWQAECSFPAAGTYTFICTVHPVAMKGSVIVSAAGTTTTTTTATGTSSTGATTTPPPAQPPATSGPAAGVGLLAGATSAAVRIAVSQHGQIVRGSLALAPAAAGGRLELELLATLGGRQGVLVGRLSRPALSAGRVSFALPLDARARRALHRRGHLALHLRVRILAGGGTHLTLMRAVTLHG